ncbi:MAG: hypothetical protein V4590_04440 [Bacteroidota bacterium]
MKRTTSTILFAALMLAALVSCKKEDDSKETSTTTTTTSSPSTGINPLTLKNCTGKGDIEVNSVKDTIQAREAVMAPLKLFGIYCETGSGSLVLQSGDSKLPGASKTFTVMGDSDKLPGASEMVLQYYDEISGHDYYATSGTVSYIISSTEKTVTFTNIIFKNEAGNTKTISFEVRLK